MENFSHFIITRFNLRLFWKQDKNKTSTRTEAWLKHRFDIFEQYCLPSIAAQTCKDFVWLCLFDEQTPEPYRQRIITYQTICRNFQAVFYSEEHSEQSLSRSLYDTISKIIAEKGLNAGYVVTTNLDNDDSLSIHAVETLQQRIRKEDNSQKIYSLLFGYQFFTSTKFAIKMRYTNNHFLTLVEPYNNDLKTIIFYKHGSVVKQIPTVYIATKTGMWLEVVHKANVSNEFRINVRVKYIPIMRGRTFDDFGLKLSVVWWKQWLKNLTILPFDFITDRKSVV